MKDKPNHWTKIKPCKIPFKYPWADKMQNVTGIEITRLIHQDEERTPVTLMDRLTSRPACPTMACVIFNLKRVNEEYFSETTTTHIPLV